MKKYLSTLQRCPLFQQIETDDLLRMLSCFDAKVEHFDKKYTVMAEGNPVKYIGIVLSGSAQIIQIDYYGNRSILSDLRPAQMFAESFVCAGAESIPYSVIATEPCDIMLLESNHILHTCARHCGFHHQIIYNLMKALAEESILFHQKMDITSKRSTRDKLLAYLSLQAKQAGSHCFDIPFNRQELADYLGVDRSGLCVEIRKLQKEGVLFSNRKHFELISQ